MANRKLSTGQPLSSRELQIATLVAQGATNRDVAVTLELSPKTVGAHLQRIYRKLGIHRRSRLAYLIGSQQGQQVLSDGDGAALARPPARSAALPAP